MGEDFWRLEAIQLLGTNGPMDSLPPPHDMCIKSHQDICYSFSYQDVSLPTRLALHHHGQIINKDEIDTCSDISQALPYSQILVKLCPVLVLPNKLV